MKILSFRKTTFVNIVLIFISYVPNTLFHFKEFFSQSKYFHEYIQQKMLFLMFPTTTTKSLQSYLTLCDPTDGSPPGSPIPGILQARILEWVAISFSNA